MNAQHSQYAICRYIKTNGHQCQSPALTGNALCFFHNKLHDTHRRPQDAQTLSSGWQEYAVEAERDPEGDPPTLARVYPHQDELTFPALEDAESVQLATSMLFQAIATGQIYFKRARLLLATLKIACINQHALATSRAAESADAPILTSIVRTPDGQTLAAPDQAVPENAPAASESVPHPPQLTADPPSQSVLNPSGITILAASSLERRFCRPARMPSH
jgi:hypothetical protein